VTSDDESNQVAEPLIHWTVFTALQV
jgi:hypothetical protein